ncbi:RusA family crossover junction endodeoxyribonuclease [Paraburkholderia sp. 31.1]|nr:RusA family crossover junction endodeoxyribonuclease [Paraburkholderia sp. 31.1]
MAIAFTILGEPASKANSRSIVSRRYRDDAGRIRSRPMSIRSEKALAFERYALRQIPPLCRVQLTGPVRVTLRIFYASERPDLDESVILDVLQNRYTHVKVSGVRVRELAQAGVYMNDRQVREKHVYHGIDRTNPRTEVIVEPLAAQQCALGFGAL